MARQVFVSLEGVTQPMPAPRLSQASPQLSRPPHSGEHSEPILRSLNLTEQDIAKLRENKVI